MLFHIISMWHVIICITNGMHANALHIIDHIAAVGVGHIRIVYAISLMCVNRYS
jgi:hypothetical protein